MMLPGTIPPIARRRDSALWAARAFLLLVQSWALTQGLKPALILAQMGICLTNLTTRRSVSLWKKSIHLVSAKFSLSHAAISAPQLLDCEALFGSE
jgi:hypothetical protein